MIRYIASDEVEKELGDAELQRLGDFFMENVESRSEIEYVKVEDLKENSDELAPMYTMKSSDGKHVLAFPIESKEGVKGIYFIFEHECPWLDGLSEYGVENLKGE